MMKKIFKTVFIALVVSGGIVSAQVGINTTTPAPGSILDIESTDKAVVLPRVSISDLNTIAPVTGGAEEGMIVYNTNDATRKGIKFWDGMRWQGATEVIRDEIIGRQIDGSGSGFDLRTVIAGADRGAFNLATVYTTTITLTKTTLVEIIFQTDVSVTRRNNNLIDDGDARLYGGRIILPTGGPGGTLRNLITDTHSFTDSSADNNPGPYYVRGSAFVTLPAGNHDLEYIIFVAGSAANGTRIDYAINRGQAYVQVILHN